MNIHVVGVHSMNFCSYIVGAVRDCVSEVKLLFLSYRSCRYETINSLPLQGELYLPTD